MLDTLGFARTPLEQRSQATDLSEADKKRYFDFLNRTLSLDPNNRPEAEQLLETQWLNSA